jgi:hypothetical protein
MELAQLLKVSPTVGEISLLGKTCFRFLDSAVHDAWSDGSQE